MLATVEQPHAQENQLREFTFPRGIAGFSGATRFAFIYEGQGNLLCLQSIDQPEASFILTPWDTLRLGQPPQLSKEQLECLNQEGTQDIRWFVVLNPFADKQWVTANLKAPIVICEPEQTGLQCIRNQKQLELRYKWMKQPT